MIIENDIKLDFSDVLIKPKRSTLISRKDVGLIKTFKPKYGKEFLGIPIIAANMATGTFDMLKVFGQHDMFVAIAKHHNKLWFKKLQDDDIGIIYNGFYTMGISDNELNQFNNFYELIKKLENERNYTVYNQDMKPEHMYDKIKICIDVANGYTQNFSDHISKLRDLYPNNVIVAGNIATPEMTEQLIIAGADYVKIGIGPGSVCTTRKQTGVGYPQLSAAIECSDAAHGLGGGIILDGGMRTPGDVAKAFCANADMVMLGGMFAGTDEMEGDLVQEDVKLATMTWANGKWINEIVTEQSKIWYGMSSDLAQEKHFGGTKDYRTSEGAVETIAYKGPVENVIKDLLGGLRSTGTYIGANSIKDFGKCATFVRVTHIHDKF